MVGISRFMSFNTHNTIEDLKKVFKKWKFELVEEHITRSIDKSQIIMYLDVWYYSDYQDTEFHYNEWLDSLEYLRTATSQEIEIYNSFSETIDLLRGTDGKSS